MKMFGASANVGTILCSLIALASVVASRIVGCDTLDCRLEDDENKNNCPLSDDGVGTTTFQSNATSDGPLTWSVVGNTDRFTTQEASKGAKRIMKSFYLGTPSTLLLQNADFRGCSLVFFNITPALQTVPGYDDFPNFGCDTVLGSQCATDLLEQARQELNSRLSASPLGSVCDAIGKVLTDTLPHSCRLPFGRTSWGPINVVGFAGRDNVSYVSQAQGDCDITSQGSSYNTVMTNLISEELDPDSEEAGLWRNGTTPLITMLYKVPGDVSGELVEPETHLTCLRTVPSEKQASENAGTKFASASWLSVVVLCLVAVMA